MLLFIIRKITNKKLFNNFKLILFTSRKVLIFKNYVNFFYSFSKLNTFIFNTFSIFFNVLFKKKLNENLLLYLKVFITKINLFSYEFFKSYISILSLDKKLAPRKIFFSLIHFLKSNMNCSSLSFTKTGLMKKKLRGFKIQLKGRFEATKNSMSKKIFFKSGKVNSTNLEEDVIFYNHVFFSKLGLSNLKI